MTSAHSLGCQVEQLAERRTLYFCSGQDLRVTGSSCTSAPTLGVEPA